jgi:hypothetical protein
MDNATNGVEAPELIITNSFNCLLSRMAALDYAGILISGRKTLRNAKRQRVDPTMRLSDVIQMTGMTKEDLETFISCRLISMTEAAEDPVLSFRDVICLVKIFSAFARQEMIR